MSGDVNKKVILSILIVFMIFIAIYFLKQKVYEKDIMIPEFQEIQYLFTEIPSSTLAPKGDIYSSFSYSNWNQYYYLDNENILTCYLEYNGIWYDIGQLHYFFNRQHENIEAFHIAQIDNSFFSKIYIQSFVAGANDRGFKYYILKEDRLLALIELDEVINRDINIDGMDEVVKSRSYSGMPTFYIWDDYSLKSALFQFHNKGWILVYLDQVNSFELIYWDDGEQKYQSLGCYKCNQDFTLSLE